MTETVRRLRWHEAAATLNLSTAEHPDWPERLALPLIARLHDPSNHVGMLTYLAAEADAGRLKTETVTLQERIPGRARTRSRYLTKRTTDCDRRVHGPSYGVERSPDRIVDRELRNASAADVAAVLREMSNLGPLLAAWVAPYRAQTEPQNQPLTAIQSDRNNPGVSVYKKYDDIAVELEDIFLEMKQAGKRITPSTVMPRLKPRAGKDESCITEAGDRFVMWDRGNKGQPEILTMDLLKSRIQRWRKKTGCA